MRRSRPAPDAGDEGRRSSGRPAGDDPDPAPGRIWRESRNGQVLIEKAFRANLSSGHIEGTAFKSLSGKFLTSFSGKTFNQMIMLN